MTGLRVLRIYHAGGDASHRARERALQALGADVTLVVPRGWTDAEIDDVPHVELAARRLGDVNRHAYLDQGALSALVQRLKPDVVDIHEEPVSVAARQWSRAAGDVPTVMYTAQNLDKRWPPPFAQYERAALRRTAAFYPCSKQAASVLRGKGYRGTLQVLPLGLDLDVHHPGSQALPGEVVLGLVGRLVPEKGVLDAVRVLAVVNGAVPARLLVVGEGPEADRAHALARQLGVLDRVTWKEWCSEHELAAAYREMHVVLVPSRSTPRWVEQFGRVITEARANGAVPVGYASGSISEVVDGVGIVVQEGDVAALAGAVRSLVQDADLWSELRARGLSSTEPLAWPSVAASQADLYHQVVAAQRPALVRPTRGTRSAARTEFGATAASPSGQRPFAVPVLRSPGPLPRALGVSIDAATGQS